MKALILKTIAERIEQVENEYLMFLIFIKMVAPKEPTPVLNMEALEKKMNEFLAEINIPFEEDPFLTLKEAASFLKISRNTLYLLRKQGKLTSYEGKNGKYLHREDVEELLETYSKKKGKI